jgi:hypothetical protein
MPHRPPQNRPLYLGTLPPPYLEHVAHSTRLAMDRLTREHAAREQGATSA